LTSSFEALFLFSNDVISRPSLFFAFSPSIPLSLDSPDLCLPPLFYPCAHFSSFVPSPFCSYNISLFRSRFPSFSVRCLYYFLVKLFLKLTRLQFLSPHSPRVSAAFALAIFFPRISFYSFLLRESPLFFFCSPPGCLFNAPLFDPSPGPSLTLQPFCPKFSRPVSSSSEPVLSLPR